VNKVINRGTKILPVYVLKKATFLRPGSEISGITKLTEAELALILGDPTLELIHEAPIEIVVFKNFRDMKTIGYYTVPVPVAEETDDPEDLTDTKKTDDPEDLTDTKKTDDPEDLTDIKEPIPLSIPAEIKPVLDDLDEGHPDTYLSTKYGKDVLRTTAEWLKVIPEGAKPTRNQLATLIAQSAVKAE
jgi:hypothetical protein